MTNEQVIYNRSATTERLASVRGRSPADEVLDIPHFRHSVDATELALGSEDGAISGYFATSGLDACRRRLNFLDESVIAFQLRLIQGSVAAKRMEAHRPTAAWRPTAPAVLTSGQGFDRPFAAQSIAEKLMQLAFDDGAQWLGFDLMADCRRFAYRTLGMSLYSGSLGIAVFFSCLSRSRAALGLPQTPRLDDAVRRILGPLVRLVEPEQRDRLRRWWRDQPLGLAGAGGQLLALIVIDDLGVALNGLPSCRDLACELLEGFDESMVGGSLTPDLTSGALGLVGLLLRLRTEKALRIAELVGDLWITELDRSDLDARLSASTLGFSNGVSGVAAALGQLYRYTNNLAVREAVSRLSLRHRKEVEAMEVRLKSREAMRVPGDRGLSGSWCHGLAGAVFGRLCLKNTDLWNQALERETRAMLNDLTITDFHDDCLCCGSLGGATVLRIASKEHAQDGVRRETIRDENGGGHRTLCAFEMLNEDGWGFRASHLETLSFDSKLDDFGRWRPSDLQRLCFNQPGLMNGASGVGLALIHDSYGMRTLKSLMSAGLYADR